MFHAFARGKCTAEKKLSQGGNIPVKQFAFPGKRVYTSKYECSEYVRAFAGAMRHFRRMRGTDQLDLL